MTQKIKPLPITQTIIKNLDELIQDLGDKVDEGSFLVAATVYGAANAIVAELVALRAEIASTEKETP